MKYLVLDTEATTYEKGNPFSKRNKLMCVGLQDYRGGPSYLSIEHSGEPYGAKLEELRGHIQHADMLVGFNIKYDLHWLRRYVPGLKLPAYVWDCQLAEFYLGHQTQSYPSLNDACLKYGLPPKDDLIKRKYWDQGIDTDQIPADLLKRYNQLDVHLTHRLFKKQRSQIKGNLLNLFTLHCQDLLVLEEMEFRGLMYNTKLSEEKGNEVDLELRKVNEQLAGLVNEPRINWNSTPHVSAVLYGGSIAFPVREKTAKTLKDGRVKEGERWGEEIKKFPRLVEPLDSAKLAKDGVWSVAEDVLKTVKAKGPARQIIDLVLKVSNLDKLKGTYYLGIPNLMRKKDWELDTLHGQINQCVARTARTSSSAPNLQNFDGRLKEMFYSRYPTEVQPSLS